MPKSDHLHFDFFCASRMELTRSGPSASRVVRTTTDTGELGRGTPAFAASSSRADCSGVRRYADAACGCLANKGGFLLIRAKALRRIGVVDRRFFFRNNRVAL